MRVQLSVALQGIMTQQLLPTADGSGRVVATEVLVPTPAVRNLIREGKTHQIYSVLQTGMAAGMQTMDASLAGLVRSGKITQQFAESRCSRARRVQAPARSRHAGSRVGARAMSSYVYKALDLAGAKAGGEVEADSKEAVADQLKARGLIVLDIADKHSSREIELAFMKRVKPAELAVFARQLATMINSGMSILRALYVLEGQTDSKFLKDTIVAVRKDVEAGRSLSESMASSPQGLQPAVRRDDPGRRDGRCARGRVAARRRPVAEGLLAAQTDQIGDGLPDARRDLRRRRDDGARRLPRAGLPERVQTVRR